MVGTGIVDWLFRNRQTGRITIGQRPNVSLLVFLGASAPRWLLHLPDELDTVLVVVATAALITWSIDELFRGVNPWRRILGAAVLLGQVIALMTG